MSKPNKPGIYWAKSSDSFTWFNLIVVIGGEAPWLFVESIFTRSSTCPDPNDVDRFVFGPEIIVPKAPKPKPKFT